MTTTAKFSRVARIRQLNDMFRNSLSPALGRVVLSEHLANMPRDKAYAVLGKVIKFDKFTEDNDPHREHDFGCVEQDGEKFFWKIDYYDRRCMFGSEDPCDLEQTTRVLTVMLASEY
jgi:hypothetical protein